MEARRKDCYSSASQPILSLSLSNPCESGDKTVKFFCPMSSQFKGGGGGWIQKSGYDGSQLDCGIEVIGEFDCGTEVIGIFDCGMRYMGKQQSL